MGGTIWLSSPRRRARVVSSFAVASFKGWGSNPVNQNIQRTLQHVAMFGQRTNPVLQLCACNRSHLLNANNPRLTVQLDRWSEARKRHISAHLAQRGHDTRRIDPDQISLQIHNKLTALQAIKIKLSH